MVCEEKTMDLKLYLTMLKNYKVIDVVSKKQRFI